ncbi:MAG: DUF2793 domain-containing protein [Rubellimicrobium sp.]|nr:DUF2793 domain-containing protein [Rubellimicrobium sp.]
MSDLSPLLGLPYLLPAQAQKHVTHNEALERLDALVHLAVTRRDLAVPPPAPAAQERHIVAAGATGDWAGHAGEIALHDLGGWRFFVPQPGWRAEVLTEGIAVVFDGAAWQPALPLLQNLPALGIGTTADATNALAVAAPASLLTHAGAGHQLKINKAATGATASLLFQSDWSGRAEMGLAGGDDFGIKVSADGSGFTTALSVDRASGRVFLPAGARSADGTGALPGLGFAADPDTGLFRPGANQIGLAAGGVQRALVSASAFQIDLPLTGTAVQAAPDDTTAGRVLTVGAFGLGGTAPAAPASITAPPESVAPGIHAYATPASAGGPAGVTAGTLIHLRRAAGVFVQMMLADAPAGLAGRLFTRIRTGGPWSDWRLVYDQAAILGTVAQSGGVPTGAVIERGTNADGDYLRLADGTQICTRALAATEAIATALPEGGYRSAGTAITWPLAFVAAPVVTMTTGPGAVAMQALSVTASGASAAWIAVSSTAAGARSGHVMAVGRWF